MGRIRKTYFIMKDMKKMKVIHSGGNPELFVMRLRDFKQNQLATGGLSAS